MVEYVPQNESEIRLCLTEEQKALLPDRLAVLRKKIPALFISLPGDEEKYSDINLRDHSLEEALRSPFMSTIRESHHLLGEAKGGCTLWENREWVRSQLNNAKLQPS